MMQIIYFKEQYKFIYDTLEETLTCGQSWFPVSELTNRLKQKSARNLGSKLNEYQREYAVSYLILIGLNLNETHF